MPTTLLDLPDEVFFKIFNEVAKSNSMLGLRSVHSVFRRLITSIIFKYRRITFFNCSRRTFDDKFGDIALASAVLSNVSTLRIDLAFAYKFDDNDYELAKKFVTALPRLIPNTKHLEVKGCTYGGDRCLRMHKLLSEHLTLLPPLQGLELTYLPFTQSPTVLPPQLTHLDLNDIKQDSLMNFLVVLLDHLPQLVSLDVSNQDSNAFNDIGGIDGQPLVDWVQNAMERKNKQHPNLKKLCLGLYFQDNQHGLLPKNRVALLAFLFFTLPHLDSLIVNVAFLDVDRAKHPAAPPLKLTQSILERSNYPSYLSITVKNDATMQDDVEPYSYLHNKQPQSHIKSLSLYFGRPSSMYPWIRCFPHVGIETLALDGSYRENCHFTWEKLANLVLGMPRLALLTLTRMILTPGSKSKEFRHRLSVQSLELYKCSVSSIDSFVAACPNLTHLHLNRIRNRFDDVSAYSSPPIDNPWASKLHDISKNHFFTRESPQWVFLSVANLSLSITKPLDGMLYIILQDQNHANSATPLIYYRFAYPHDSDDPDYYEWLETVGKDSEIYTFSRSEINWLLKQIDQMHAFRPREFGEFMSFPWDAQDEHDEVSYCCIEAWSCLISGTFQVLTCLSIKECQVTNDLDVNE
ncbi:hypothetical protein BC940DRAFT_297676 [Gongronella butleri]|nr:hypothetical protein BC940DRAFT_297676 [Gongronella butleri]